MKLTAKTDLEVPAAVVFAALIDTPTWEREAIRNGVEVERPPGTPDSGVGAEWRIRGHFRGKARKLTIRITEMTPDQRVSMGLDSPSVDGVVQVEVMVLSPRRSRLRADLEIKPKTLAARAASPDPVTASPDRNPSPQRRRVPAPASPNALTGTRSCSARSVSAHSLSRCGMPISMKSLLASAGP